MKPIRVMFTLAFAACQPSARGPVPVIQTVGAVSAPFAEYRTFAFGPAQQPQAPYALSARSFEVERRAQPLVVAELTKKGYAPSDGKADFLVQLSAGNGEQAVASGGEMQGVPTQFVSVGELVIDVFDGSSHTQVWHGEANVRIDPQKINEGVLQTTVQELLVRFPVRSSDTVGSGTTDRQSH